MKGSELPGSGGNQAEVEDPSGWEALASGKNPRSYFPQFVLCHFNPWPLLSSPSWHPLTHEEGKECRGCGEIGQGCLLPRTRTGCVPVGSPCFLSGLQVCLDTWPGPLQLPHS